MQLNTEMIAIMCALTASQFVYGDVIPIENAGFENPKLADNESSLFAPGWDLYNPNGLPPENIHGCWNPPIEAYPNEAPEGENIAWVWWCFVEEDAILGLSQTLKATLQANTTYTLTVRVGNSLPFDGLPELEGFPGYRIELLAGGTVLAVDDNSQVIIEGDTGLSSTKYSAGPDDPNIGLALSIRLINLLDDLGAEVDFDDVMLTADPELMCPWDLDGSGSVGTGDLLALFTQWGTDGPADFDESGAVGTGDLLILFANWGPCP